MIIKKFLYPDWFDVPCAECGEVLRIFCFTKKDRVEHLHFCDEEDCRMTEAKTIQFELQRQYGKELKDAEGNSKDT